MKKFLEADGGNPDGTAKDRDGVNPGTRYLATYYNDNIFNLFEFVQSQGYTLIDNDLSQIAKASKARYNPNYTYNTSAIATQSVSDIVEGSDGKFYQVQNDGVNGDNPVNSVTGNWLQVPFDNGSGLNINGLTEKTSFVNNDLFVIEDSENSFSKKKVKFSTTKKEIVYNLTGTDLNASNGTMQSKAITSNVTFTSNLVSGESITLRLVGGDSHTVTYPSMIWYTVDGNIAPALTSSDVLVFWNENGTLYGAYVGSAE